MDSRRGFFTSLVALARGEGKEDKPFHPLLPGFIADKSDNCLSCITSACKNVCEEGIIVREDATIPYLYFSRRGCTFCGECISACESDCFVAEPITSLKAQMQIGILSCLAWNKTICRSCADVCNDKAIQFTGLWNPEIDSNACTVCGFCVGVCPASTITIHPLKETV
ncbi:4Fe-4S binding protein [Sulfuricurvum sp.]|uniref:4Fe-4S binding protein n=1 Tax=Sulfuricurvum sp. TaxID=2025608 RepID=UPI003BB75571